MWTRVRQRRSNYSRAYACIFEYFLQCGELKFDSPRTIQQLRDAHTACKAIDAADLVKQGLKGKAIAASLYEHRLAAINTLLNQRSDNP